MERIKLREIRKNKGLTQKKVAEVIGVSRPMYTSIENGTRNPSLRVVQNIIDFFGDEAKEAFFNNEVA
ncbi:helix-turn-helix transcriptional regulator [Sporohalobacter salinus]|uniref:helix-turn-helix transcriptional regulator n=1 Tax=Sporohalobacter salinus TaxID=1494606 RepID=UPI00195F9AA7|nr:helix-turn-helix transcriptional regulator [Sporohalobacter salinus]MBM7623747.1 putative transcriptional regulator [Sporohalobacter salinus]